VIDWGLAARVAGLVAGPGPDGPALPGDLDELAARSADRVVAYTRLEPAAALPPPESVARDEWIDVNLSTMRATLAPLTDRLGEASGALAGPARAVAGTLLAAEVGALTGYMGQRVLGQYELALLDPHASPRLLFVEPNIRAAARRMEADEAELLAWIAFHEVTHAVQFGAVGWLRDHIGGLVRELLASVDVKVDPAALLRLPTADDLRALVRAVRDGGLVAVVAGPERRETIDRVQAVMALVEGHAEHVMDAVGAGELKSLDRLRDALDRRRRERPPVVRLLERLIGLDLKMRQYEIGRRFCDAVVAEAGVEGLNRAWGAPALLPTLAELDDPPGWLERTRTGQLPA
jgi:coenzyme F420 biosynthesis associated uncharacterized protein